jgi:hypothetical protein
MLASSARLGKELLASFGLRLAFLETPLPGESRGFADIAEFQR